MFGVFRSCLNILNPLFTEFGAFPTQTRMTEELHNVNFDFDVPIPSKTKFQSITVNL